MAKLIHVAGPMDEGPGDNGVPAGPVLSVFDPVFIGIDEFGHPVVHPLGLALADRVGHDLAGVGEPDASPGDQERRVEAHGRSPRRQEPGEGAQQVRARGPPVVA